MARRVQEYRADIDGLRAIAVLALVLFHAFPALIPGGLIGVDIFFVISGFLITRIIGRELEHGKFTFARFDARRIKRIFPALVVVMAACLAFAWFALFPDELKQLGLHLAGGAGFTDSLYEYCLMAQPDQQATRQMLEIALATDSIRTVIFSSHVRLNASTPDGLALVDKVRDTLRRYLAAGKQVIYMDDVPVLSFDPRACIRRAGVASSSTRTPCAFPRTEAEAYTPEHGPALAKLLKEFPGIGLFQTAPQLCDDQLCWAMKDGNLPYRDKNHLSYEGDRYIGKKFAEWQALRGAKQGGKPIQ